MRRSRSPFAFPLPTTARPWLAMGLIGFTAGVGAFAAEAQPEKLSRLGFKFDQQAHDAAVAARQQATLDDVPAEADVVRLPRYTVTEEPVPLEERELLTPKGRIDVATKRYISPIYGKTVGPLMAVASFLNNPLGGWSANTPEAMSLYADDEWKRRNARTNELNELAKLADEVKRPAAQREKRKKK